MKILEKIECLSAMCPKRYVKAMNDVNCKTTGNANIHYTLMLKENH